MKSFRNFTISQFHNCQLSIVNDQLSIITLALLLFALPVAAQTDSTSTSSYSNLVLPPAGVDVVTVEEESAPDETDTLQMESHVPPTLPWPQRLQARLEELIHHPMFETSQVGLMVHDLTSDSVIFRYNHRQLLRPASTMKVITAVTALDRLGGGYKYRTRLCANGKVEGRTLRGDLYCVGGMDPLFDNTDLKAFVESVRAAGIDTIQGRLIADLSFKDNDILGEGWCWDDDNPMLTPLLIGKKDQFMQRFEAELHAARITLTGNRTAGRTPLGVSVLCERTHTIDEVLTTMMKESDNLFAESVFYQTAAASGQRPASASHARQQTRQLIKTMGLDPAAYKVADGSGLSLYNYVSAELEVAFLKYAFRDDMIFVKLYSSLPIAGVDGTLKKRMKKTAAANNVHAKTGTVSGISSLAGYCTASNGHRLAFCIINQGVMRGSTGRAFQDRVCIALCE